VPWIPFRDQLFPLATLVTPNLDEVRLLVDIEVIDSTSQRGAAKALHALGPRWVLVKGGHLRSSDRSCDLLYGGPSDGVEFYEFDAPRVPTGNDHGGGDTLAAAVACALAHGFTVPDAVGFGEALGHRVPARRLSAWRRPRPRFPPVPADHDCPLPPQSVADRIVSGRMNLEQIAGVAHEPDGDAKLAPKGVVALTHGAGGSRESLLLQQICDEWARRGWLAVRYNLPFRRHRPKGPPSVRGRATGPESSRRSRCAAALPTAR